MTTRELLSLAIAVPLTVPVLGCAARDTAPPVSAAEAEGEEIQADTEPENPLAAELVANMDPEADPCQDFYRYACGGWIDNNEIPSDQARWSRFNVLRESNQKVLRSILAEPESTDASSEMAKASTFYAACMDEGSIETAGSKPLQPMLQSIDTIKNRKKLADVLGELHQNRVGALFALWAGADYKDPDLEIAQVYQGGLGLPDRDYYVEEDERTTKILAAYEGHVAEMLGLLGQSDDAAKADAKKIVAFETKLAEASMPRDELRNPEKRYHKIDLEGLRSTAPQLPWKRYLKAVGHPDIEDINVAPPSYFESMGAIVKNTELDTIKAYLRWHTVHSAADHLSKDFVEADFRFYGQMLKGQKELQPRWKRCVNYSDRALGEILGQGFVETKFAGDSKGVALEMIRGIEEAFENGLGSLSWMDDGTRKRAVEKMHAIVNKIGYPDQWRDYSKVEVSSDDHFQNISNATAFEFHRRLGNVGKPVDKKEWHMTPPTVNAYYNPSNNEMVFPAGILQPPFFHRDYAMAMNFGGIGMVMGHELTHGFDDQGRKFDGSGRLTEWWDPSVIGKFEQRAQCVEDLYSSYEVQPDVHINGKLTLGENIADLGGVKEAYRAYEAWVAENGKEPQFVDELTNEQLFFVSFGQIWCGNETPEAERVLVKTDSHSRPQFRVNGPLANTPEFWEAFSCEEGSPMHPKNACEVW